LIKLDYKIENADNDNTLMFIHGVASNLNYFKPNADHFKKDYRVISVSLRGHGKSSRPENECLEEYTVTKLANDIIDLVKELEIESFHYIGHSMGGILGYELLGRYPEYFRSLTACGSPAEIKIPLWLAQAGTSPLTALPDSFISAGARAFVPYLSGRSDFSKRFIRDEIVPYINPVSARYCMMNLSNISYLDILERSDKPVFLIHGKYDIHNMNLKTTIKAIKGRKNTSYAKLEKAGHNANLDFPEEFNNLLERFLKNDVS
jgi:pimeloyl-ACP methyl ester carboxylesterase